MSRRALYSAAGALLALGAPLGLLLLQSVRARRLSGAWLVQELSERTAVHVYVSGLLSRSLFGAECRSADLGARWGGDEFVVLAPET